MAPSDSSSGWSRWESSSTSCTTPLASLTFLERGNVTIRVGSARAVLALKLRASRPGRDFEDIAVLVRACGFTSVSECEALVEDYFLGEEEIPPHAHVAHRRISRFPPDSHSDWFEDRLPQADRAVCPGA